MQELPPALIDAPTRSRRDRSGRRTGLIVDAQTRWPGSSNTPWIRWHWHGSGRTDASAQPLCSDITCYSIH